MASDELEAEYTEEPLYEGIRGLEQETEDVEPDEAPSPASATSESRKRRKGKKLAESDLSLLRATDELKPYQSPNRKMIIIWEIIAQRVSSKTGIVRIPKYCRDRITQMLKKYRAAKNKKDPTGDGQHPDPTEEEQLLHSIDAAEEEGTHMNEIQKEKATQDQALIDQLEKDTLMSFAKKSHRNGALGSEDEWEDERRDPDKEQAEMEAAMGNTVTAPMTPSKKRGRGQYNWSPWKRNPGSARRDREELFREKFRVDVVMRKEELQEKKDEREFQREKFQSDKAEREEDRKVQREKDERADQLRREELGILRQNSQLLQDLVVTLVKKN